MTLAEPLRNCCETLTSATARGTLNIGNEPCRIRWNRGRPSWTPQQHRSFCRTWWNPVKYLKPPLQNLVKWWWNLVEPLSNLTLNLLKPWWNPGGTLVKPDLKTLKNLVEPYLKPPLTLAEPGRTLGGTLPQTTPLVEPWQNPRGTLPQTIPPEFHQSFTRFYEDCGVVWGGLR